MARARPVGECYLCGRSGPLSFEHVPPKKAFNDRPIIRVELEKYLRTEGPYKGPKEQRGLGGYTLCEPCNNDTGGWYGPHFIEWAYQGMEFLRRAGGKPSLVYVYKVRPLSVLKQIITMFFSVNGDAFRKKEDLRRFVLNREQKYLPPGYRFFVYYNHSGSHRMMNISGSVKLATGKVMVSTEFSFPPFGYVMTFDSEPHDRRLFEITHFSRYGYHEFDRVELRLPVLATHTPMPGDYRSREDIQKGMSGEGK